CRPLTDRKFSFRGEEYALLKSDVYITAHNGELLHLDAAQPRTERRGQRVFINPNQRSSGVRKLLPECTESTLNGEPYDRIYGEPVNNQGKGCYAIPDDMLVYLCREAEGHPGACDRPQVSEATNVKFDVYIRLSDLTDGTIEDLYPSISSCFKPPS